MVRIKNDLKELQEILTYFVAEFETKFHEEVTGRMSRMYVSIERDEEVVLNVSSADLLTHLTFNYSATGVKVKVSKLYLDSNGVMDITPDLAVFDREVKTKEESLYPKYDSLGTYYKLVKTVFLKALVDDKKGTFAHE